MEALPDELLTRILKESLWGDASTNQSMNLELSCKRFKQLYRSCGCFRLRVDIRTPWEHLFTYLKLLVRKSVEKAHKTEVWIEKLDLTFYGTSCKTGPHQIEQYLIFLSSLSMLTSLAVRGSEVLKGSLELIPGNMTRQLAIPELGKSVTGETAMLALVPAIAKLTTLSSLCLHSNQIGDVGVEALVPVLGQLTQLTCLDLSSNEVGDVGAAALMLVLGKVTGLMSLALQNNNVAIPAILLNNLVHPLNVVAPSPALDMIEDHASPAFRSGVMKAASVEALAPALGKLIGLASLDMSGTYLGEAGWIALAPELAKLTKLKNLYLAVNDVPATGLANLDEIAGLTNLDLTATQIGEAGAVALAPVLGKLKGLTSLSLHSNNVGDAGLIALAPMLGKLSGILSLNLRNNQIGDACIEALTLELDKLTMLRSLDLGSNNFSDAGQVALALELSKLRRLRVINLG